MNLVQISDAIEPIVEGASTVEIVGGAIKYHNDRDNPAIKDEVVKKILPTEVPECIGAVTRGHCISAKTLGLIDSALKQKTQGAHGGTWKILGNRATEVEVDDANAANAASPSALVVKRAKDVLGCDSEMCVLKALEPELGRGLVSAELSNFKIKGPTDNKLLSNINIDAIMTQYATLFPGFFPFNFNMRNYASYRFRRGYVEASPDSLATIQFTDLYANGHRCCGCVINDDTYQGPGTHWMALFADARGSKWTVEFFNSSGNAPAPEWVNWLTKTRTQMEDIPGAGTVEIKSCSALRHQQSRTECGLYSLFYIFARLNGVPCEYFMRQPVPDQLMFEFRQLLFSGEKGVVDGKFDWEKYRKQVSVAWE